MPPVAMTAPTEPLARDALISVAHIVWAHVMAMAPDAAAHFVDPHSIKLQQAASQLRSVFASC